MLVSHDRALLRAVCDEFWLVSKGGIAPFDGDLDDYQRYLLDVAKQAREAQRAEQKEAREAPVPAAAPAVPPAEQKRQDAQRRQQLANQLKPLRKELEQVDKRMAALNAEKADLENRLSQGLAPAEIAESGKRLKAVGDELDELEMRWLELSEAIEGAQAG